MARRGTRATKAKKSVHRPEKEAKWQAAFAKFEKG